MCDEYYKCSDTKEAEEKLENAQHFFEAILEALYSKEPIPEMFEDWLDECAGQLQLKMPQGSLQIEKKNRTLLNIQFLLQQGALT